MLATQIIIGFTAEIEKLYEKKSDFDWTPGRVDIECTIIGKESYFIDYTINGYKSITAELSYYKKISGKWMKRPINQDLKLFIEETVKGLIYLRFDELEEAEKEAEKEQEESDTEEGLWRETQRSLSMAH